jgi:hypothetical protein
VELDRFYAAAINEGETLANADWFAANASSGGPLALFGQRNEPDYQFVELYQQAKAVYSQLVSLLLTLNEIMHV